MLFYSLNLISNVEKGHAYYDYTCGTLFKSVWTNLLIIIFFNHATPWNCDISVQVRDMVRE